MFEQIERDYSFASGLAQLVLAFFGPLIIWGISDGALNIPDSLGSQIAGYFFVGGIAFGSAIFVSKVFHDSALEGRWVWVLPAVVATYGFLSDARLFGFKSAVSEFFVVTKPQGEDLWIVLLLTTPTFSCCCYSAAMWWSYRQTLRYTR